MGRKGEGNAGGFSRFFLLWAGEFISAIGSGLTSFGLGIYVYQMTGKATAMAIVELLAFLPALLLGAFAGVLADRYDRRMLMLIGDSFSAVGIFIIWISMLNGSTTYLIVCIGVTISSIFSSLMEPAYKATVSDLLTEDEYAKASGLVQIAASSKYLISPVLAGFLLSIADIKLLLVIDICTFFVTVFTICFVKKGIAVKKVEKKASVMKELAEGMRYLKSKKGILILAVVTSFITLFMGFIQTLATPLVLGFADEATLGTIESVIACGMLVSSVVIGVLKIKKHFHRMLYLGLLVNGIAMFLFGVHASVGYLIATGFLFFLSLPFANTAIDVLVRKNLDPKVEGRVWGLLGIISQLGYVFAYAFSGVLADYVFTPLLMPDGPLAGSVGKIYGVGAGRGIGLLISIAGLGIIVMALVLSGIRSVKELDHTKTEGVKDAG